MYAVKTDYVRYADLSCILQHQTKPNETDLQSE
jgi:hypothetical protein